MQFRFDARVEICKPEGLQETGSGLLENHWGAVWGRLGRGIAAPAGFSRRVAEPWHTVCYIRWRRIIMFSIRQKLVLGFGGLLASVAVIGALTMSQIKGLGAAIDVILRENYVSVVACQNMQEALDRIDKGVLFTFLGAGAEGRKQVSDSTRKFTAALAVERGNITLPGEGGRAERIAALYSDSELALQEVLDAATPAEERRARYFERLHPLFEEIRRLAGEILEMNQANMSEANDAARAQAESARRRMMIAILACAALAIAFSGLTQRWILDPIRRLIDSANEIRCGNLDLVLAADSKDEIGQLSAAFNAMAEGLRGIRRSERRDLMRNRRATSEVFKALPSAIAVLDLDGRVEVATRDAEDIFGLKPGVRVEDLGLDWLAALVRRAQDEGRVVEASGKGGVVQIFRGHRERFFAPAVVPILMESEKDEITGTAVILKDVTSLREQQELKRSAVTTVSHQLRNPLTSIRMSIHLLLEETLGPLNARQVDLLLAAREESERLTAIVEELLDLNRMESGRALLDLERISPRDLVRDSLEPFHAEARDKGIALVNAIADDLPEVLGDTKRLQHVLSNLLSNALRFTPAGGAVTVAAEAQAQTIRFTVTDSGSGIPAPDVDRVFEPFYRVTGQGKTSGIGLGLAIVREIVRAHGGRVGVSSSPGRGAAFWFTLPEAALFQPTARDGRRKGPP
jgi:signal transduction histidine kinase